MVCPGLLSYCFISEPHRCSCLEMLLVLEAVLFGGLSPLLVRLAWRDLMQTSY